MKFKLFKGEYYDQQTEKHNAYTEEGWELTRQEKTKEIIVREYSKVIPSQRRVFSSFKKPKKSANLKK